MVRQHQHILLQHPAQQFALPAASPVKSLSVCVNDDVNNVKTIKMQLNAVGKAQIAHFVGVLHGQASTWRSG